MKPEEQNEAGKRTIKCPACEGAGKVEVEGRDPHGTPYTEHWSECEECNGHGEYEVECD